jgi:DNA-damage-inducible protein D
VSARHKLIETEKELSQIIYEQTWNDKDFWTIRSKWDKALFGKTTQEMKTKWWVSWTKSLAGFMPTYC